MLLKNRSYEKARRVEQIDALRKCWTAMTGAIHPSRFRPLPQNAPVPVDQLTSPAATPWNQDCFQKNGAVEAGHG